MIVVSNQSKKMTDAQVRLAVLACNAQLQQHVAPAWKRTPDSVLFAPVSQQTAPGDQRILVMDAPDEPDALGYHSEDEKGRVYGRIFVNPVIEAKGVMLFDPKNPQNVSVASVLSHEVAELFVDPFVNVWVDGPAVKQGSQYALEVCDPVEGDSYTLSVRAGSTDTPQPVSVSNFVFPEWFDDSAPAGSRFDQMSHLKRAFSMSPGGYMVVRKAPGTSSQVFGATRPDWRTAAKAHTTSRATRRTHSRHAA